MKSVKFQKLLVLSFLPFFGCNFLALDEQAILKDSKAAFKSEVFREEPFQKAAAIQAYADFLLRHSDTLFAYNQLDSFKTIQISEGGFSGYKKETGDCFTFLTNNEEFMDFFRSTIFEGQ